MRRVLQPRQRVVRDLGRHLRPGVGQAVGDDEFARAPAACRRAAAARRGVRARRRPARRRGRSGRGRSSCSGRSAAKRPFSRAARAARSRGPMRLRHNGPHGDPPPRHASARARAQRPGRGAGHLPHPDHAGADRRASWRRSPRPPAPSAPAWPTCRSRPRAPGAAWAWARWWAGPAGCSSSLLRESGVAMGFTIISLSFCSTMALAWGLRAGPLSFIPILALIFTLAAPPPATRTLLWIHSGWTAVGGAGLFLLGRAQLARAAAALPHAGAGRARCRRWPRCCGRARRCCRAPMPAAARRRCRTGSAARSRSTSACRPRATCCSPRPASAHTGPAIAVLLQAVEMRDTLLAGELDIELLGHDGPAGQLRERLRVHGMRVADAVDAMAQALARLRHAGAGVRRVAAGRDGHRDRRGRRAAPGARVARDRAGRRGGGVDRRVGRVRRGDRAVGLGRRAASPTRRRRARRRRGGAGRGAGRADVGPAADPASLARNAAAAARAQTPARVPLFASTDPRYPLAVAFYGRARQMVAVLARMQAALRGEVTPLPLARDELQVFISTEGWPLGRAARAAHHALADLPPCGAAEPGAGQRVLHRPGAALGLASALAGAERGAWCCAATSSRRCRAATTGCWAR